MYVIALAITPVSRCVEVFSIFRSDVKQLFSLLECPLLACLHWTLQHLWRNGLNLKRLETQIQHHQLASDTVGHFVLSQGFEGSRHKLHIFESLCLLYALRNSKTSPCLWILNMCWNINTILQNYLIQRACVCMYLSLLLFLVQEKLCRKGEMCGAQTVCWLRRVHCICLNIWINH